MSTVAEIHTALEEFKEQDEFANLQALQSKLDEIQIYPGCVEPGHDDEPMVTGNWNTPDPYNQREDPSEDAKAWDVVQKKLEDLGVELEWCDEWTSCADCGKAMRTSPNSYDWTRAYYEKDGDQVCFNCLDPEELLEDLINAPTKALLPSFNIDLTAHGYLKLDQSFQNGLHEHQDASPAKILASLQKRGATKVIFQLDSVGQFDVTFSAWILESEQEQVLAEELTDQETDGPSPSEGMKKALQSAALQMREHPEEGIRVVKCSTDGTAVVKVMSPEDFVEGRALD